MPAAFAVIDRRRVDAEGNARVPDGDDEARREVESADARQRPIGFLNWRIVTRRER